MGQGHILVVDDEPDIRGLLKDILEDEGYEVTTAENAEEACDFRRKRRPDLILLDIWMPDTDGITLLKQWSKEPGIQAPVVMMSGHGTVDTAVEATQLGAYDFIEKPLSIAKIVLTVQRTIEAAKLMSENIGLKKKWEGTNKLIGCSPSIELLKADALRLANHKTSVFLTGESGTGKETLAHFIHQNSSRSSGRFVGLNVAALARENPEEEFFGSETNGNIRFGSLELANGGTLFLKDVADMDLSSQARLLNALENQAFFRLGGQKAVDIDIRIIASTSKDLKEKVLRGEFREDFFYHLNVLPLDVPPLRDRKDDIPILLDHFLNFFHEQENLPIRKFSNEAKEIFKSYQWPGNIRELKNLVQRLLILGNKSSIEVSEIEMMLNATSQKLNYSDQSDFDIPLREARENFEKSYIEHQMSKYDYSVSRVSAHTGIERTHLYRKLRALGIDPKQLKESQQS
jgi:two-component system, NtrC family, nitrogen regulation response regulator NtrX